MQLKSDTLFVSLAEDSARHATNYIFNVKSSTPEFIKQGVTDGKFKDKFKPELNEDYLASLVRGWKIDNL